MFARAITPTALLCALALPVTTAAAQGYQYAPGTNQYRMAVEAKITQTVMGQSNDVNMSSGQKFTMVLEKQAADTLSMTVTIDSIGQTTPMGPVPGTDALVGKKVKALLSPAGRFYASASPAADSIAALAAVADQLEHLLPRVPVKLAAGATWTDTVNTTSSQGGLEVKRQVISIYTVAGDSAVAGNTAWKINRTSTSTSSGSGAIQGQAATLAVTSTGTGVVLLGRDGTFLGGTGEEVQKGKLTLTDAGVAYDIDTTAKTQIDRVN